MRKSIKELEALIARLRPAVKAACEMNHNYKEYWSKFNLNNYPHSMQTAFTNLDEILGNCDLSIAEIEAGGHRIG